MGAVTSKLFASQAPDRVILIGFDGAGKTTILYKFKLGDTVTHIPTIGFCVESISYKNIIFGVWQLPIGDKIWPLMRYEAQMARAIIFVVDSASPERFAELRKQVNMLLATPELKDAPVLIYANKQDLENAATAAEISEALQLASIGRPWFVQCCCAITGDGLFEGLDWLSSTTLNLRNLATKENSYFGFIPKISSLMQPKPVPTEVPVDVGDKVIMIPNDEALKDSATFIRAFEHATLPADKWNHYGHVRVGWTYLRLYDAHIAHLKMVDGIQKYNAEVVKYRKLQTGFHLTMTIFWMTMLRDSLLNDRTDPSSSPVSDLANIKNKDLDQFLKMYPHLSDSRLFLQYYSPEVMFSAEAKASYVQPDKKPLPIEPIIVPVKTPEESSIESATMTMTITMKVSELDPNCAAATATTTETEVASR